MKSSIEQTAEEINLEVRKKVDENEIISKINQSAEQISIEAEKINLNGAVTANENFKIKTDGSIEAKNGTFTGGKVKLFGGNQNNANFTVGKTEDIYREAFTEILPGEVFVDNRINGSCGFYANAGDESNGNLHANLYADSNGGGLLIGNPSASNFCTISGANSNMTIYGDIYANEYNYNSREELKKNIEKIEIEALKEVMDAEIYEFNYKTEKDNDKKHIGFIIGNKYKTPENVMTKDKKGINTYSMVSILWKAIQEQQKIIKEQGQKLKELEGKINGSNS